jgi:hypothetical protein
MFDFVKNYLTKREGKSEYEHALSRFLTDGKLNDSEKKDLEGLAQKYNFTDKDLIDIKKKYTSLVFKNICSDQRITEEEKNDLESIMSYFGLSQKDFEFSQNNFNKFYSLALIDKGILPIPQYTGFNVILKKGEIVHWLCPSTLKKRKKVTKTINYSGFTGSIKITKGLRYRVGSINLSPQTSEIMVNEDSGNFWLTDQRIGFLGGRKNFNLPYSKILSFEAYKDAIIIHKDGRETPYIVGLDDVELPVAILSEIINR